MKGNKFKVFSIFLLLIFNILMVNSASFSLNESSLDLTLNKSENFNKFLNISNGGSDLLNLTIQTSNLTNGSNDIEIKLNSTSIINLNNSILFNFSFNSGVNAGNFSGNITFLNQNNSSDFVVFPITLEVLDNTSSNSGNNSNNSNNIQNNYSIEFVNEGSILDMEINVDDSSETKTFTLRNNGNLPISDIKFKLDDLDGDNDRINNDDIEINGELADQTLSVDDDIEGTNIVLDPGDTYKVEIYIDIPSNLDVDTYRGDLEVYYTPQGYSEVRETYQLRVKAISDKDDVKFDLNYRYVSAGTLKIVGEPGEYLTDYEVRIENDASYDVENLTIRVKDSQIKEEDTENYISASAIEFSPSNFNINDNDDKTIDLKITIPDDQPTGTYVSKLELISSTGKKLDSINLEIEVIGDIYIKDLKIPTSVTPDSFADVEVVVRNKGSSIFRNLKVSGTLFDVDTANSNDYETTSNFILNPGEERKEVLRFKIPDDAKDGSKVLEIRVQTPDGEIVKVKSLEIKRPTHRIKILNYNINPIVAKCDKELYSYIKFQNLGKYDEDVKVETSIYQTNVVESTNTVTIAVDEIFQKSLVLDISSLEPGDYRVITKVFYNGGIYLKEEKKLKILSCSDNVGVELKPISNPVNRSVNESLNETSNGLNKNQFGNVEFTKTTKYLAIGLGIVIVLIIISIFML